MLVTYLDAPMTLPARMPSPFGEPHAVARHAASHLRRELDAGLARDLGLAGDGKMFGVLVVRDRDGRLGFMKAFSGMVRGTWLVEGFVPPAFDLEARDQFWPAGEQQLDALAAEIGAVESRIAPLQTMLAALAARHEAELVETRARHRANREARRDQRARISCEAEPEHARISSDSEPQPTSDSLHALDQLSRRDAAERRRLDARHADERAAIEARLAPLLAERAKLDTDRTMRSRALHARIFATYSLPNARGEIRSLDAIFAPAMPPGGAGDCAAPKLLAYAYRHALQPIALAEFWIGAPPAACGRSDGQFYPACRGKCGPVLAHMLDGIDVEPAPVFGGDAIDAREPITLFEDRWLAIVVKPVGLLSVPGKGALVDSVQTRLRDRYPGATGPLIVHRLDLDTSGVLLAAKDLATYAALQRQFAARAIEKRYIAWLDGDVRGDGGVIELPLRVDLDDRPRQIVDEKYGKSAMTAWRVLDRAGGLTRVALEPRTGRAHQLRVHAAHPRGIGVPIVGDRLYGRPDTRLLLHAEAIGFVHPHTHEHLVRDSVAPF
jgi:tRNA pseudouridine32 synthase/23S rRNA pseudouridine746 synthase